MRNRYLRLREILALSLSSNPPSPMGNPVFPACRRSAILLRVIRFSPALRILLATALWLAAVPVQPCTARQADQPLAFADGRISCVVLPPKPGSALDPELIDMANLAMATALRTLPPPPSPATLTIRPPYPRRLFFPAPVAAQRDDEIALEPEHDRVKLAFRLAHEMSHWLAAKAYPQRPPLWLDEGLAQRIGAQAAAAAGRTEKRGLARTPPDDWESHALSLDALTSLSGYGTTHAQSGAFYWQAERLVDELCARLGPDDFRAYLAALSTPPVPDWQAPLRERWWFNDADFEALARAIAPHPHPTAP